MRMVFAGSISIRPEGLTYGYRSAFARSDGIGTWSSGRRGIAFACCVGQSGLVAAAPVAKRCEASIRLEITFSSSSSRGA